MYFGKLVNSTFSEMQNVSLLNILNSRGLRTDPCVTPVEKVWKLLYDEPTYSAILHDASLHLLSPSFPLQSYW